MLGQVSQKKELRESVGEGGGGGAHFTKFRTKKRIERPDTTHSPTLLINRGLMIGHLSKRGRESFEGLADTCHVGLHLLV